MNCSLCQSVLPEGDVVLCEKCDLGHVKRMPLNTEDFWPRLQGKNFIFRDPSMTLPYNITLRHFSASLTTSPDVKSLSANNTDPEILLIFLELLQKLPNCTKILLPEPGLAITEQTAPYLSELMALPQLSAIDIVRAKFTSEACQAFIKTVDPDRFSVLSLKDCTIPDTTPILNALVGRELNTLSTCVSRPITDEECSGLSRVIKSNKRVNSIELRHLSIQQSKELAQALLTNNHVQRVTFNFCDLVTAMPMIAKLLRNSPSIAYCSIDHCNMTLSQLTELCEGLTERTSSDLELQFYEGKYADSLQPIAKLLKENTRLTGLDIMTSCDAQEWLSVVEAVKNNTRLKVLKLNFYQTTPKQLFDVLTETLKVNDTLRQLYVGSTDIFPVLDQLVEIVVSRNKLEICELTRGKFKELSFQTLCDMLKKNWKLQLFSLNSYFRFEFEQYPNTEENIKLFTDMLEENNSIVIQGVMKKWRQYVEPYTKRNLAYREHWTETKQDLLVIIHNMARNVDTIRELLPIDMWLEVFKHLRYPLMPSNGFENVARKIFKLYKLH